MVWCNHFWFEQRMFFHYPLSNDASQNGCLLLKKKLRSGLLREGKWFKIELIQNDFFRLLLFFSTFSQDEGIKICTFFFKVGGWVVNVIVCNHYDNCAINMVLGFIWKDMQCLYFLNHLYLCLLWVCSWVVY